MKQNFFLKHASKLAKKYTGKYIVVADEKVIAVGRSALEAYKKAKRQLLPKQPFGVYYLPKPKELLTALWISLM